MVGPYIGHEPIMVRTIWGLPCMLAADVIVANLYKDTPLSVSMSDATVMLPFRVLEDVGTARLHQLVKVAVLKSSLASQTRVHNTC